MKCKLFVLAVWLTAFSFSCHHPDKKEIIPISRRIIADTVCSYPYLYRGIVSLKNDLIIMVDPLSAGEMDLYNLQTGKTDYVRTAHPDYFSMKDDIIYPDAFLQQLPLSFYHSGMDSYYYYTLENDQVKLNRQILRLSKTHLSKAEQISDNKYVTLGFFRKGLLGLWDKKTKLMNYYGHYPITVQLPLERDGMEKIVQSFQGYMAYSDQHSKVVFVSRSFAYLSCYHYTGKKFIFQWEKHILPPPEYIIADGFLEIDKTVTRGGFWDVTVAGDYIFASYSQENKKNSIPDVTHSILVYDMTGNHIASYQTDYPISGMMIDTEHGFIYGISREDLYDPVIVRFRYSE